MEIIVLVAVELFHATLFPIQIFFLLFIESWTPVSSQFYELHTTYNASATLRQFGVYKHQPPRGFCLVSKRLDTKEQLWTTDSTKRHQNHRIAFSFPNVHFGFSFYFHNLFTTILHLSIKASNLIGNIYLKSILMPIDPNRFLFLRRIFFFFSKNKRTIS